ncbi:LytR C-terminal domain-containing protein [Thiomonas sp. FB-Cd]|uniref:LytR C-terminal domain-containing protein n=1 Tax=Thiomonas sp. FB-Cd TaxID=1158292 RepID=UPI000AAFC7E5|nr:LytR C-terminal domain-containing protein [Thiomonas sp. FB-Cd]
MLTIRPWIFGIAAGGLLGGCAAMHPQTSQLGTPEVTARQAEGTIATSSDPGNADYVRQLRRHVEICNALAVMQARQGHYGAAERLIRQALVVSPRSAYLYNNLGYVELLRGDLAMARQNFEFARELDPRDARAQVNLRTVKARLAAASAPPNGTPSAAPPTSDAGAASPHGEGPGPSPVAATGAPPAVTAAKAPVAAGQMALATPPAARISVLQAGAAQDSMALIKVSPNIFELRWKHAAGQALAAMPEPTHTVPVAASQPIVGLEVSNGNGVTGMAYRVARYLHKHANAPMARLTNLKPYTQPVTEIRYRPGMLEAARAVNHDLPEIVQLVEDPKLAQGTNVRVVLGHDAIIAFARLSRPTRGDHQQLSLQKAAHVMLE